MKRLRSVRFRRGFTLMEMLIAVVLMSLVVAAVLDLYVKGQAHLTSQNASADLQEDARNPLAWLARDIKSAVAVEAVLGLVPDLGHDADPAHPVHRWGGADRRYRGRFRPGRLPHRQPEGPPDLRRPGRRQRPPGFQPVPGGQHLGLRLHLLRQPGCRLDQRLRRCLRRRRVFERGPQNVLEEDARRKPRLQVPAAEPSGPGRLAPQGDRHETNAQTPDRPARLGPLPVASGRAGPDRPLGSRPGPRFEQPPADGEGLSGAVGPEPGRGGCGAGHLGAQLRQHRLLGGRKHSENPEPELAGRGRRHGRRQHQCPGREPRFGQPGRDGDGKRPLDGRLDRGAQGPGRPQARLQELLRLRHLRRRGL